MFDNLRRSIQLKWVQGSKAYKDLQQQLEVLSSKYDGALEELIERDKLFEESINSGEWCIEAVLKRGIDYYDSSKLEYAEQVTYKERANEVLKNETFQNEIRHLEADWVEFCAKGAKTFEEVRDMRMAINALQLIVERLEAIPDPRKPKGDTDLFEAI
jgi:hypothetical protein